MKCVPVHFLLLIRHSFPFPPPFDSFFLRNLWKYCFALFPDRSTAALLFLIERFFKNFSQQKASVACEDIAHTHFWEIIGWS